MKYNQFFINLFKGQNNVFRPKKCLRCDEFLLNHRFKVNNGFLVPYSADRDAFGEKPIDYKNLGDTKV